MAFEDWRLKELHELTEEYLDYRPPHMSREEASKVLMEGRIAVLGPEIEKLYQEWLKQEPKHELMYHI